MSHSKKSVQWELSCYTWTDRQAGRRTDMTKLMVAFRDVADVPKNCYCMWIWRTDILRYCAYI